MTSPTTDRRLGLVGNTAIKAPVACATTGNIVLSGEQTIDGVTTAVSRVLVWQQTNALENGIYDSSSAGWTRTKDADGNYDVTTGSLVYVQGGATLAQNFFIIDSASPVTPGLGPLQFRLAGGFFPTGYYVSPMDYMAVGDGIADDTAAVLKAMNTGLIVDLRGRTYGVSGTMKPTLFGGMFHGRLKQLTPAVSAVKTLWLHNRSNFVIRDVTIDLGGLYTGGSMTNCAGIWIDGDTPPNQFVLDNVRCTNGGPGNGLSIQGATNFVVVNPIVDQFFHNVGAVDDVIQGVWYNNCTNFRQIGGDIKALTGISTVRYTRGYTFGGCSSFSIVGAEADTVDQCFDITGTLGNHDFVFSACVAKNGGTFGFKFANSAYDGQVVGCIATDIGFKSFVVSGPTEVSNPLPHNIQFVGCKSKNVGSSGVWGGAQAFRVESTNAVDDTYPRGIRFVNCEADDDQATTTMTTAFSCDAAPLTYSTAGYNKNGANTAVGCKATWAGTPGQTYNNIHFPIVSLTGTGSDTLATSTWVRLSFDVSITDTSGLHSTSLNSDIVYVKEPGWYLLRSQIAFQSNNAGLRQSRFSLNGAPQAGVAYQGAHPTLATYLSNQAVIYVDQSGYSISCEAYQTSGGSLTTDRTQSFFSVIKVG